MGITVSVSDLSCGVQGFGVLSRRRLAELGAVG